MSKKLMLRCPLATGLAIGLATAPEQSCAYRREVVSGLVGGGGEMGALARGRDWSKLRPHLRAALAAAQANEPR